MGGAVGVLQSAHPGMAAMYTGAQCFVLGSSFLCMLFAPFHLHLLNLLDTRQACLLFPNDQTVDHRRRERLASAFAGTFSGAAAGRFCTEHSMRAIDLC
jgi:hypothetical protein